MIIEKQSAWCTVCGKEWESDSGKTFEEFNVKHLDCKAFEEHAKAFCLKKGWSDSDWNRFYDDCLEE